MNENFKGEPSIQHSLSSRPWDVELMSRAASTDGFHMGPPLFTALPCAGTEGGAPVSGPSHAEGSVRPW